MPPHPDHVPSKNGHPAVSPRPPMAMSPPAGSASSPGQRGALASGEPVGEKTGLVGLGGFYKGTGGPVGEVFRFLNDYLVLSPRETLVIAGWVVAAWLAGKWDRFPHLAITSPEKRCGKTLLLRLLAWLVPRPCPTSNISPAVLYHLVTKEQATVLLDEAQSMERRGSESSEQIRELFNAGIDKDSCAYRMGGKGRDEIQKFTIYSPKVIALIGKLDNVLADRCLAISMKRKTENDRVLPYRSRLVKPKGEAIAKRLEEWAAEYGDKVADVYDNLEPFPIDNDRMAELIVPLQAVLTVCDPSVLSDLEGYAFDLQEAEAEDQSQTAGVMLLKACREIFDSRTPNEKNFIPTAFLLDALHSRTEERWGKWHRNGDSISADALASLLRPYGIKPGKEQKTILKKNHTMRGYYFENFVETWDRYLPPRAL